MPDRSKMPMVVPEPLPEESPKAALPERRKQDRYPLAATAEVLEVRSQTRIHGRCSDLSAGGCYVDTLSPFSVGSIVNIRIAREPKKLEAIAVVSYAHVSMGMGLAFSEIKPEHRQVLRYWIAELSGEPNFEPAEAAIPTPAPAPAPPAASVPAPAPETGSFDASTNVRFVMNELITLLVRKKILNEDEAAALFRQMLR
jgi:hypothetical protein